MNKFDFELFFLLTLLIISSWMFLSVIHEIIEGQITEEVELEGYYSEKKSNNCIVIGKGINYPCEEDLHMVIGCDYLVELQNLIDNNTYFTQERYDLIKEVCFKFFNRRGQNE